MITKQLTNVFVYGTLKKGQHANNMMGPHYMGPATVKGYTMYCLGGFPCVMRTSFDAGSAIHGEMYQVDDDTLDKLNLYEGIDQGLFKVNRVVASVLIDGEYKEYACYIYVWGEYNVPKRSRLVDGGDWRAPTDTGYHNR